MTSDSAFWRSQVWKRRRALLLDSALWASLALASLTVLIAPSIPLGKLHIETLANFGLIYAALSFAAAISAVGICFGIPGVERIRRWATIYATNSPYPVYSNLVFVFAWAAMVQVGVVIVSFLSIAFGSGYQLIPAGRSFWDAPSHYFFLLLALWLWWYAVFELTAVIRTVVAAAAAIMKEEESHAAIPGSESA